MKDATRKAAAAAAHRTPPVLRRAQVGELGKVVQRCQASLDALRAQGERATTRPFHLQQKERALAEAIADYETAAQQFQAARQEHP